MSLILLAILASCDGGSVDVDTTDAGSALDRQAIANGILPDPEKLEFAGRYEARGDLGTDKFCAVASGANRFEVGVLAVFGPESKCEGRGSASIIDDKVRIALSGEGQCEFDAQYDGVELRFPGTIESGCARYCSDRASLSGTHYFIVQPGDAAARQTLGRDLDRLCD